MNLYYNLNMNMTDTYFVIAILLVVCSLITIKAVRDDNKEIRGKK